MDIEICRRYAYERWRCDYYATAIGVSLVVILGVFGNAGTLFTLSGRRLATATFVYYRAIACVDLCRCVFVFTYVLRVLVPFRRYYWTTWYEAHLMYFLIGTLGFISTTLAVLLCFRLCYCIVQSRRMKKMHTNANETKRIIYGVATASFFINLWLCFERQVRLAEDECASFGDDTPSRNEPASTTAMVPNIGGKKYALAPSEFSYEHSSLLKAVHNIPIVVLLVLLTSTLALLLLCIVAFSGIKQSNILTNRDSYSGNSRTWRTQRQLCRLFLVLSLSYAFGLLPTLIYEFFFNYDPAFGSQTTQNDMMSNATVLGGSMLESQEPYKSPYEQILASITRRQISATILNVIQNLAHAISFYIYISCSEEFRNEFKAKLRRIGCQLRTAYSSFRFSLRNRTRSVTAPNMTPMAGRLEDEQHLPSPAYAAVGENNPNVESAGLIVSKNQKAHHQRPLLSENEGDDWDEELTLPRRTQSDLRFCKRVGGIAREFSCQFYKRVGVFKEQANEERAEGFCFVFENAAKNS